MTATRKTKDYLVDLQVRDGAALLWLSWPVRAVSVREAVKTARRQHDKSDTRFLKRTGKYDVGKV